MAMFFLTLRYTFGNEDWRTEQKALEIKPQDRVLCITASGDRPLNLLLNPCQEIVCIDANKIQNYLLSLKSVAMQAFDYPTYLAFLGAYSNPHRKEALYQLLPKMPPDVSQFWLKNEKIVAKGILYQGAVERLVKKASNFISIFKNSKVHRLFEMKDLEEQKAFIQQHWNNRYWRKVFEIGLHPILTKLFIHDPGLYKNVNIKPGHYIYDRMYASLEHCLARENLLISLILKGEVPKEAYPPYLTEQGTEVIKKRLNSLSIQTSDIISYLENAPERSFDCFSLSDVASYLKREDFIRLLRGIYRTAKPGARFSIRQFLSFHEIPDNLIPFFSRNSDLEKQLEKEDRCFVYRFMVGSIIKE
jgi:S-adenosylmethionine-diacylglycerol 3-amino-3-carboxypropyl transferase